MYVGTSLRRVGARGHWSMKESGVKIGSWNEVKLVGRYALDDAVLVLLLFTVSSSTNIFFGFRNRR